MGAWPAARLTARRDRPLQALGFLGAQRAGMRVYGAPELRRIIPGPQVRDLRDEAVAFACGLQEHRALRGRVQEAAEFTVGCDVDDMLFVWYGPPFSLLLHYHIWSKAKRY